MNENFVRHMMLNYSAVPNFKERRRRRGEGSTGASKLHAIEAVALRRCYAAPPSIPLPLPLTLPHIPASLVSFGLRRSNKRTPKAVQGKVLDLIFNFMGLIVSELVRGIGGQFNRICIS